jgi:hypothetical protein
MEAWLLYTLVKIQSQIVLLPEKSSRSYNDDEKIDNPFGTSSKKSKIIKTFSRNR